MLNKRFEKNIQQPLFLFQLEVVSAPLGGVNIDPATTYSQIERSSKTKTNHGEVIRLSEAFKDRRDEMVEDVSDEATEDEHYLAWTDLSDDGRGDRGKRWPEHPIPTGESHMCTSARIRFHLQNIC